MSEIMEIGQKLVEHCRSGTEAEALATMYHADVVSVEAAAMGEAPREMAGMEAIKGKHAWWSENFEVHDAKVEGPFPHGDDRFAVTFWLDTTNKMSGERSQMSEVAVYHVKEGKIAREEFFYPTG
ncbi:MAG: nuclear transport factor 2 family protein [Pseudomonadota bacterium]